MKINFLKLSLRPENQEKLEIVNEIIEDYLRQGFRLTLRQLYYQLVSKDLIPNKQAEYNKLGSLMVKGRMGGVVDWNAIEDRIRKPYLPYSADSAEDAVDDLVDSFRLNRQMGQENHIEVWIEKDAISNLLLPITKKFHVNLMVNRGYSSCSAMFDSAQRFKEAIENGQDVHILYLGDHDPSGLDMIRDIEDRTSEMLNEYFGSDYSLSFHHIGITDEQIQEFSPPPNPTKIRDPRAKWYLEKFGNKSWEVDALPPNVLHSVLREKIEELIDMDLYREVLKQEEDEKFKLNKFTS